MDSNQHNNSLGNCGIILSAIASNWNSQLDSNQPIGGRSPVHDPICHASKISRGLTGASRLTCSRPRIFGGPSRTCTYFFLLTRQGFTEQSFRPKLAQGAGIEPASILVNSQSLTPCLLTLNVGASGRNRTDLVSAWKADAIPTRRHSHGFFRMCD